MNPFFTIYTVTASNVRAYFVCKPFFLNCFPADLPAYLPAYCPDPTCCC